MEVKRLRDRANESDERRAEAARLVAKRAESLERDVEARDAELQGPAGAAAVRRRGTGQAINKGNSRADAQE